MCHLRFWEEADEQREQPHRVDGECPIVGELDPDDLEQVPSSIRTDAEHPWRVGIRVQIDNDDRVRHGVLEVRVPDSVPSGRRVDLHTRHIVIHNTARVSQNAGYAGDPPPVRALSLDDLQIVYTGRMPSADTTTVRLRRPDSERLSALAKSKQTTVVDV